ncbi:tetratricopeptide repeat protein [Micromonospora sp. M12]
MAGPGRRPAGRPGRGAAGRRPSRAGERAPGPRPGVVPAGSRKRGGEELSAGAGALRGAGRPHRAGAYPPGVRRDARRARPARRVAGAERARPGAVPGRRPPRREASARNAVGWAHAQLGQYAPALAHCREALALLRTTGDRHGEANTWDSLGFIHARLGDHRAAVRCFRRAIGLYRRVSDRYDEADTLSRLGESRQALGTRPVPRVPGGAPWASSTNWATRTASGYATGWPRRPSGPPRRGDATTRREGMTGSGSLPVTLGTPAVVDRGTPTGARTGTP